MTVNKVENTVSKVEIAHHELFLLLPECFQNPSPAEASESIYISERVKQFGQLQFHGELKISYFQL